jgi:hypothetical protein
MALEITGKLVKILQAQSGAGAKGNWVKQEFVIETTEQYPKKLCISLWGDKVENLKKYSLNDEIKVSFNLESREYNERWYTDIRAWKIESAGKGTQEDGPAKKKSEESMDSFNISGETEEDLPF